MSGYPGQVPILNDLEQAHHLSGSDCRLLPAKQFIIPGFIFQMSGIVSLLTELTYSIKEKIAFATSITQNKSTLQEETNVIQPRCFMP